MNRDEASETVADEKAGPGGAAASGATAAAEECPVPPVARRRELIDNLPYLGMILTGAALFWLGIGHEAWRLVLAAAYIAYGVGGAFWIMLFVCPYCHFYATRLCPCGYGQIAAKLRPRADADRFATQFKKHIPVIVPLWFLPLVAGGVGLFRGFSWVLVGLLLVFAVNSFVVLPLVSRKYGCTECPQKEDCPWMGGCKGAIDRASQSPGSQADGG